MRVEQVGSTNTSGTPSDMKVGRTEASRPTRPVKQVAPESIKQKVAKPKNHVAVETDVAGDKKEMDQDKEVIRAIEKANQHIRTYDRKLEFTIHEATKKIMVKVVNTDDGSVIREIPSEKVLDMVAHLWELAGILVDEHR